ELPSCVSVRGDRRCLLVPGRASGHTSAALDSRRCARLAVRLRSHLLGILLAHYTDGMEAIVVTDAVRVPAAALTMRAVRASGPGGQNVNKVASKVDLRVDLDAIEGLSDPARERLRVLALHRLDAKGRLQ